MEEYEYHIENVEPDRALAPFLARMGADGWMLVQAHWYSRDTSEITTQHGYSVIMMRRKKETK